MLTPEQFKTLWTSDGELVAFPESAFAGLDIAPDTMEFLKRAGLPDSAAPFLSFGPPKSGPIQSVSQVWGGTAFSRHYIIGMNGSGDPVALLPSGRIVYLNHDRGFAEVYINRDVFALAEALLQFRQLVTEAQREAGADAYLDGLVPTHLKARFVSFMSTLDPAGLDEGAMWAAELEAFGA